VLALNFIRTEVQNALHVRLGPILALSYKNHALDEFLIDVVRSAKQKNLVEMRPEDLIRAGKPEHEDLQDFGERNNNAVDKAQDELARRVALLRKARQNRRLWIEFADALEDCLRSPDPLSAITSAFNRMGHQGESGEEASFYAKLFQSAIVICCGLNDTKPSSIDAYKLLENVFEGRFFANQAIKRVVDQLASLIVEAEHWKPSSE
jgi:hypothetical protein